MRREHCIKPDPEAIELVKSERQRRKVLRGECRQEEDAKMADEKESIMKKEDEE